MSGRLADCLEQRERADGRGAFGAFTEAGGPYDKKVAARLSKYIFSVGNTVDPAEAYRAFRGRDPRVEALMVKRGFAAAPATKSGAAAPKRAKSKRG